MTLRQTVSPNYNIGATRGWCLQYVDNAISAPNAGIADGARTGRGCH